MSARTYTTRSAAQRAANRANDRDSAALWVIACGPDGWYIENLNDMDVHNTHPRLAGKQS